MVTRVGINGFGRIGRLVTRATLARHPGKLEVVAVNDLAEAKTNAHLFKYDTNFGVFGGQVEADTHGTVFDQQGTNCCHPTVLAVDLGVDISLPVPPSPFGSLIRLIRGLGSTPPPKVGGIECSWVEADRFWWGDIHKNGLTLHAKVRADFVNSSHENKFVRNVDLLLEVSNHDKTVLSQVGYPTLKDYEFKPHETMTKILLEFESYAENTVTLEWFRNRYKRRSDWEIILRIHLGDGTSSEIPLNFQDIFPSQDSLE